MLGCEPLAELLFVRSLAFAKEKFTGGLITNRQVLLLTNDLCEHYECGPDDLYTQLLNAGLWHQVDGGFLIDGWANWNDLDASRAGALGNHKRWHESRGLVDASCPYCQSKGPPDRGESGATSPPIAISTDQFNTKHTVNAYSDEFSAWWLSYPQKAAKAASGKAFERVLKTTTLENITEGTERWKARWEVERTELKHIPYATTFLNQRRFEDEFDVPSSNGRDDNWGEHD